MKILKKDKQQMFTGLLKHTPPPATPAAASDQDSNAHTAVPTIPRGHLVVGPKDQLRLLAPVGSAATPNHCAPTGVHAMKHSGGAPRPPSSLSEEDDGGGGGGGRVKKKRKKKDRREWERGGVYVEEKDSSKPKKWKEEKGPMVLTLRRSKEPKERKERRRKETDQRNVAGPKTPAPVVAPEPAQVPVKVPGKRGRKPKIKVLPPETTNKAVPPVALGQVNHAQAAQSHGKRQGQTNSKTPVPTAPKQRGRKPKVPGTTPVEKKKKGKRRNQEVQEAGESDDTTSMSALNMEDSQDPLDNSKRRSGRQVKRRKYNEDLDFKVVDDDGETIAVLGAGRISALNATALAWQAEEPPEDEANIIEKILSVRKLKKEASEDQSDDAEEFYVKYRNFSYLHCKWASLEELEKDPRIHQKIKRFRTKQAQMKHLFTEPDEDLFNPDYVEVDRVLEVAVTTDTETGEEVTHYLVKWCSLSYEEATWELQEDVDPEKIREFEEIQKPPPDLRHSERPPPEKWQKLERSRDYRNGNQLREYQLEGMNWLLFNWYNRKNCILADEMGLGKTIQSITFLYEIFTMGIRGPFLIIAPLSTITNWEREFRTWTHMNVIVYHGSQISRQMILQYEMFYRDVQGNPVPGGLKFHGLITTFEMIMADCPELKKLQWRCVVIDEAHRLKNRNCKLLEGLKLMNLEQKVLLTGTPLQNSVEELFSLLNFLEPQQFPSESSFLEEFGDLKTDEQVKKLQSILKPMMLRRLKDDVEKNLAPKEETIIEVELTNIQKKYYRAILEKNFSFLSKGANQHNMPNLINTMMELRKCCNHPYLITGAEEKILESFKKSHSPEAADFQLQAMIQAAGKLVLIDKLLPKLLAGGHKVLVFSQMVRCLDILEDYLIQRRYTYERIDGRVRGNLRQAAIDRFCKPDSDRFVFLLCTRAGGLGINLTAADTCIIFDSDWNPQNDLQAQARCHRIGQSKAVKVYRLITRNSYEREMFDKASLKLGLDKAVLQDINRKGSLNGVQQLSKLEVEDLLKKGAYGALMDEEDEGSKFCEEDIDQILQRRTQTITIQSEGKGSTFAKASFVSSGNRTDISLDDPNFWQKWAKIAEVEIDSRSEKESLVIDTPRVRKQTRHYNSFEDDELMEFSELDSDSEDRPCRTRRLGERSRRYLRAECFRVEKNLLIFGWGRWKDILNHGRFKWHLTERDMEVICRALLVYCLKHYKGDDKIKCFIWDLIAPSKDGQDQALLNHSGLSAPVPRGRKGKKLKNQLNIPDVKNADWLVHCNPEVVLQDESYKKHLKQHCNKVLLRVRMLYYLKVEVLGEAAAQEGVSASKLDVALPDIDYIEIPVTWWDADADKSLLLGVHKHGYERYNAMRADPDLCFLERVGMPDVTALTAEQGGGEAASEPTDSCKTEEAKDEAEVKTNGGEDRDESSKGEETCSSTDAPEKPDSSGQHPQASADLSAQDGPLVTTTTATMGTGVASLHVVQARPVWPTSPALTARFRRLITAYQRFTLRREPLLRHDFQLHDGLVGMAVGGAGSAHSHHAGGPLAWQLGEELRRCSVVSTEPDPLFLEWQRRWTRREQADFYRTVSSYGVVYDPDRKAFDWSQFRALARLERKTDESLERYFNSFVNMCRTACKLPPRKEEGLVDPGVLVEPLSEERAARTLYRIELLRKIREQVLRHPLLSARLQLCRPSLYLPVWWESGKHDRDLLIGAARHGLSRTDFYILNDPQLSFLEAHRNYVRRHPAHLHPQSHHHLAAHPGLSSPSSSSPHVQLPHPHCCLYESGLGHHSPQPPEYPHHHLHHHHHHHQQVAPPSAPSPSSSSHLPPPPLDAHDSSPAGLGLVPGSRVDFLDCAPLDEGLELGSLQHDAMSADPLHGGKASKDALNGFPFNSAAGGQSMLNSYGVGGADLDSKLRSDVLVGEQGSSEETGLMAPSVELDQLQAPWDSTDHTSPADHMFNESDPILGPSGLETGFLEEEDEEAQGGERAGEEGGTLEECLGLPPSSPPSHPSTGDSVEPLSSSYLLFKDIGVNEEASADQTDLPFAPPPPLHLSDITAHGPRDGLADPVEDGEGRGGGAAFEFEEKEEEEMEELSKETAEQRGEEEKPRDGADDPTAEQMEDQDQDLGRVPSDLQENFEDDEDLTEELDPDLRKLEQERSFVCPEDPPEEVHGLILYQEPSAGSSLDADVFMSNDTEEFVERKASPGSSGETSADQVDEISEGCLDPVEPAADEMEEKFHSIYSEFPETSFSPVLDQAKCAETTGKGNGTGTEVCTSRDSRDHLIDPSQIKTDSGVDSEPLDLKFSVQPNGGEKTPEQLLVPVKIEELKPEPAEDVCPDSSEVKHSCFLSYAVKSEDFEPKSEPFEFPVRAQSLEVKPEDLTLHVKSENFDTRPEALRFVAYSDGKAEVKPPDLRFPAGSDEFKTESKPKGLRFPSVPEAKSEVLGFPTYPDSSEVKPEAKPEDLEFPALPEVKAELKQEMLEADSTVLTPKLEQADGMVDSSAGLVLKGQVKEEKPSTPVPMVEGYPGSPRFAAPVSMCEIPDSLHDSREPTIAQLLQEKALFSFSEWPKDRVIINRLDSICHAILKGKWPSSSEQYDSPGSLAANSCLPNSLAQHRASFLPTTASGSASVLGQPRVQQTSPGLGFPIPPPLTRLPKYVPRGGACGRGAWRLTSLPLLQERLVAPPFLPELKRAGGRRSFDYEAAAAAAKILAGKSVSLSHTPAVASTSSGGEKAPVVAPPPQRSGAMLINGWQETAIDLTKASGEISTTSGGGASDAAGNGQSNAAAGKVPTLPPITAPLPGPVGLDMSGILQAGLIHPVTGQIVNGSLRGDDSLRRRRGRRRNVEALYSEFAKSRGLHLPDTQGRVEVISHSSVSSSTSSPSPSPSERPAGPPTPSSSSTPTPTPTQTPPQPEIVAVDREAASKGLIEWLRQNPSYSMDLPALTHSGASLLHGFVERPKQRRHRCKDPTKLDVNSLTGEERVPVVHRGTGRRLGGAMAPAIKELSRWLDANSEYFVAPDWADVVKHSGFLPEGKFSRILTEPVNRDPGSRRRGRRPRSEMPKPLLSVSDSASSGLGPPLYMNGGLIGSMDSIVALQNLRGGIPGIPIMAAGFAHGFPTAVSAGGSGSEDVKNGLSMLPMMLHGIPHPHGAAISQHALFSVGTMMAHAPPPHPGSASASPSSSASPPASAANVTTTTAPSEAASSSSTTPADREAASSSTAGGEKEKGAADKSAIITSASRSLLSSAHLGAAAGSHHTFNPFLIPGVSHGLLYPHMFLPHGSIMALPAVPPGAADAAASPGSPKRRRKRAREDEEKAAAGDAEESSHPAASSSSSTSASEPPPMEETGPGDAADGPSEPQEPDSNTQSEGAAPGGGAEEEA
ncbi:chromodomain-helicase-DNA-binding protein 6 isoform X2 [Austrofundulus limnaeus]|uniref:Chromodomain-helicase-DNA-binding protein 6 isoform X2 n=1 Tax=Austrofundulus limnaeus TaxID=52670 RepID=A0A2I4BSR6_AUSLI|nr:PREDICTED: chromodomain-helicase-DNA-binding protein 6 isoform X2 [Austrofundulus limnaeus]